MLRILFFLMVTAILALADAPVLQTGQTLSYDTDGNVVPYGSIKDDGYYRAGVVRSYSRDGDIVIDNVTGLEWQDNESIYKPWVTQDNYDAGLYYDTSGDTATTYCTTLLLNNGGWRLPYIEELETLLDYSQRNPTAVEGIFNYIAATYWSSTTVAHEVSFAWYVHFNYGFPGTHSKGYNNYVRCVRGEPLIPPNLSRSGEIVTDSATGLQWQDNSAAGSLLSAWNTAINYCENTLTLGGHNDWRLPNINELLSIVDFSLHNPALNIFVFQNHISNYYWSSTTSIFGNSDAWGVSFIHDTWYYDAKHTDRYVRCV